MGLDYSFVVCIKREQLSSALQAVAKFAHVSSNEQIDVYLPEGKLTLPFTSRFKTVPVIVHPSLKELQLDTSLLFPIQDKAIENDVLEREQAFRRREDSQDWSAPRDEQGRVAIGYIYLYVNLQPRTQQSEFVVLDFMAATTSMSILFDKSASIRETFVDLARTLNASYALLNRENDGVVLWLHGHQVEEVIDNPYAEDIDKEISLAQIAQHLEEQAKGTTLKRDIATRYLVDENPLVRQQAIYFLIKRNAFDLAELVLPLLHDEEAEVRWLTCVFLARVNNRTDFDLWAGLLKDEYDKVRIAALDAIYGMDKERALELLIEALQDVSPEVRNAAVRRLGSSGDARAIEPLVESLKRSDTDRARVADALGEIGGSEVVEPLCQLCDEEAERISRSFVTWRYAFDALGKVGDERAAGTIYHLIKQSGLMLNSIVRADAVRALHNLKGEQSKQALESLANDSSSDAAELARKLLDGTDKN